jgi:uncharacterized protein with ParB-like and HNH nuclease domain
METGILPPELRDIEQLFTGDNRYSVPKYQRSFAWDQDEIQELWEDLTLAMERRSDYFLGTVVLHRKPGKFTEIIDGQQRLACVSMIFCAIRNIFNAARDPRGDRLFTAFLGAKDFTRDAPINPKLVLNNINNDVYVRFILESKNLGDIELALREKGLHESNKLLLRAYRYFLKQLAAEVTARGTDADDYLVPLVDCIRKSVKLITIPVTSEEDANLFFESLNARGKELAISDLVKNRLYSEAKDQVDRAQQLWEKMEAELSRRPIPEYLRHFWIAKKIDEKTGTVREKQLYRMIAKDVKGKRAGTIKLLEDLSVSAIDYARINDYSLWPDDDVYDTSLEECIYELRLFRVTQCNPILLNSIQVFKTPKHIVKAFKILANFSFRYFIIGNQSPGNLERLSNTIAVKIRKGKHAGPKDLAEELRAINPDATFRSDFSLIGFGKARSKIARYTLARINNYLLKRSSSAGAQQITNPDARQVTLEHVFPQNMPVEWNRSFGKSVDPKDYLYRLGNMTLLTNRVNRQVADRSFKDKNSQAFGPSKLPLNDYFRILSKWTDEEIGARQEDLAKLALEVWQL